MELGKRAEQAFEQQQFLKAAELFDEIHKQMRWTTPLEIRINSAVALEKSGRIKQAEKRLVSLLGEYPQDERIAIALCRLFRSLPGDQYTDYCSSAEEWHHQRKSCREYKNSCQWTEWENECILGVEQSGSFGKVYGMSTNFFLAGEMDKSWRMAEKAWELYAHEMDSRIGCSEKGHDGFIVLNEWMGNKETAPHHNIVWSSSADTHNCFPVPFPDIFQVSHPASSSKDMLHLPQAFLELKTCPSFHSFIFQISDIILEVPGFIYKDCTGYLGSHSIRSHVPLLLPEEFVVVEEPSIIIISYKIANYFHWVTEGLSRLLTLKREIFDSSSDSVFVVPSVDYVLQFLDLFGIPKNRIRPLEGSATEQAYRFKHAWYMEWEMREEGYLQDDVFGSFYAPPGMLRQISDTFRQLVLNAEERNRSGNLLIWVSRNKDGSQGARTVKREVVLTRALYKLAVQRGLEFVSVDCLSMSAMDQIILFSKARLIVGPHGAGLSNILWAPPNTPLVELPTQPIHTPCFGYLARAMGQEHWVVPEVSACYYGVYDLTKRHIKLVLETVHMALKSTLSMPKPKDEL